MLTYRYRTSSNFPILRFRILSSLWSDRLLPALHHNRLTLEDVAQSFSKNVRSVWTNIPKLERENFLVSLQVLFNFLKTDFYLEVSIFSRLEIFWGCDKWAFIASGRPTGSYHSSPYLWGCLTITGAWYHQKWPVFSDFWLKSISVK